MDAGPRGGDDPARESGRTTQVHDGFPEADEPAFAGVEPSLGAASPEYPVDPASAVDPVDGEAAEDGTAPEESYGELRPPRRLRLWQLAPIVGLAVLGSLMFSFPLAFEFGDGGAVVAMLGLLITGCAAGWGLMAARRVGATLPGMPPRGSGERPDWRVVALYALVCLTLTGLAVWRVARLRG
ncbi:hypothetical protein [Streptomyces sp. JJ38]|uniref:hypothetical protein n=1 Tax=Streptomyces sp. JJ38 TaxID=2738128 RepID=UPI001C564330|nr:hypothetical protein [Streptomyces sp. JJ38]MBW1595478.1 hypothetical protein [Streptomyces sp. JJ38]